MEIGKLNTAEIKQQNRQMIYNFIRMKESVSKQDIVYGLQLSLPTVTMNLQDLTRQGLIDTTKKIKNTGGRNATAYTYIKNIRVAIGLDLTGNHVKAVAVDLSGNVIEVIRKRRKFLLNDEYFKFLGDVVTEIIAKAELDEDRILGVGIAVPGLVSDDGEVVTYGITLGFTGETRERFARYISFPTRLFHDAHAAGYAEVWSSPEIRDAFYISLGNSVGGSVLVNNSLFMGETHKSGEIGHMTIVPDGNPCYCGQRGCFEAYCNALQLSNHTDNDLAEFFKLLNQGDTSVKRVWAAYLQHLAIAINNIRMLFDCKIIVGGYVGAYIDKYMDELEILVDKKNPFHDKAEEFLLPCKYKVEAIAAGAAIMYVETFIKSI